MQALTMFLVINGFILVLCSLIAISSYFLKQTGKVKIIVNKGEPEEIERGQTLFAALSEKEIFLPAACGGKGTCGRCLVKCLQGGGPVTPMERLALDEIPLNAGFRLACQVKVREDLHLELPPEMLAAKKYPVSIQGHHLVGDGICTIELKILNENKLRFLPGQYIQIYRQLPHETLVRAYSISSDCRNHDCLSLDVQYVRGGLMSTWLHQLKVGDEFDISGPYGEMALESVAGPVVLVAGGVGMAPMRSIIASLASEKTPPPTWIFWGTRYRSHLYAEQEFRQLAKKHPGWLKFVPALSGDLIEEGWTGDRGLIHEVIAEQLPPMPEAQAFVCGPGPMISAVTETLLQKGLLPERIKADPFDF